MGNTISRKSKKGKEVEVQQPPSFTGLSSGKTEIPRQPVMARPGYSKRPMPPSRNGIDWSSGNVEILPRLCPTP